MNHNDDFIGMLEDYLEAFDGMTPLPDRVRDAIRAELPSARQVQPRTGFLRTFTMLSHASAGARWGMVAVAVVAAVIVGAAFLNTRQPSGIVGAGPTATPGPTPAASPSIAAQPPELGRGPNAPCNATDTAANTCLAAGRYQLNKFPGPNTWPAMVTFDVPAGWFYWQEGGGADVVLVQGGPEPHLDSGWGVLFATVADVFRDPCDSTKGVIPAAQITTPQQLAAAMAAWPRFKATSPQPISVDGHSGLMLQLTSTSTAACADTGLLWRTTVGGTVDGYPMVGATNATAPGTFEIVDTGHGLLVIRTTDFPQTSPYELSGGVASNPTRHAADQVALHAILDSIRLTPQQASP